MNWQLALISVIAVPFIVITSQYFFQRISKAYEDFLDVLICDVRDARAADELGKSGLRVQCTQTIMRSSEDKAALAREALLSVSDGILKEQPAAGTSFRRLDRRA